MDPKTAYPSSYPFSTIYLVHLWNVQDNKYNTYDLDPITIKMGIRQILPKVNMHGILCKNGNRAAVAESFLMFSSLVHTKSTVAQRRQIGTYDGIHIRNHILCLTFHHGRRTRLTRAWGATGAFRGRRALDLRATWARAGWAFA